MSWYSWCLCLYCLFLKVCSTEVDSWPIEVPSSVTGLKGSCVHIPCNFNFPGSDRKFSDYTGIWFTESNAIAYHSDTSKISAEFQHRTKLLGDLRQRNCSLNIRHLRSSDRGPFFFRIEIKNFEKYSFKNRKVSVIVEDSPEHFIFSVEKEMKAGKKVTTTCSVWHSCPSDPPRLTWSHQGNVSSQSQEQTSAQWKITSSLSFIPSKLDHNKVLICTALFSGERKFMSSTPLSVTYPPDSVEVVFNSFVKEGDSVNLKCSSDCNPAARSFQWFNKSGALLSEGHTYTLKSVKRHTEPLYCTVTNAEGQARSRLIQLNVLYPPEFKPGSSCTTEIFTVTCLCMVDSHPASDIKWWASDPSELLNSSSSEKHGSLTSVTLKGRLHSDVVHCYASNSQGNSTLTLTVPQSEALMYIAVAVSAFLVILIIGLTVWIVKCCVSRGTEQTEIRMKTEKDVSGKSDSERKFKVSIYDRSEHVYGNMALEKEQIPNPYDFVSADDDAIYANA
ncbi:myelin-associated glycoprotein isoform X1 [Hoplias malabaricus]|uniref:myelin-associated glycoprotein isoform X1 n=1 Tax=Hoplias malabaricus TaxID=27720 RepID=UPI0034633D3B